MINILETRLDTYGLVKNNAIRRMGEIQWWSMYWSNVLVHLKSIYSYNLLISKNYFERSSAVTV